ncbi:MAG: hypothetical protein MZV64_46390 [Ignavibacteriales bacterium]|nr:hypothetical protein [Ignavibacteriales bacterium]
MRVGADAICEKPLVLNPWNLDQLQEIEYETGKKGLYYSSACEYILHLVAIKEELEKRKIKI